MPLQTQGQTQLELSHLSLSILEHQRRGGDLIGAYKYICGIYQVKNLQFTMAAYSETHGDGNSRKIFRAFTGLKIRSFFSQRVEADWNSLPDEVVTAPSVR